MAEPTTIPRQPAPNFEDWDSKKDDKVAELPTQFQARDYQIEMLNAAKRDNTIVMMPTGSGKTYVAVLLIKHYSNEIITPFYPNGKRTFFLVNQITLVHQQARVLREHTGLSVGEYSSRTCNSIDTWDTTTWHREFEKHNIFVMISQIFLNILSIGILKTDQVNVLVMDECHHAKGNHVMAQIMKDYWNPKKATGRVLGLTASVIDKKKCTANILQTEIDTLAKILASRLVTPREFSNQIADIKLPDPHINIYSNGGYGLELIGLMEGMCDVMNANGIAGSLPEEERSTFKSIKQIVNTIPNIVKEIGVDALIGTLPDLIMEIEQCLSSPLIAPIVDPSGLKIKEALTFTIGQQIVFQLKSLEKSAAKLIDDFREVKMSVKFFALIKYLIELQCTNTGKEQSPRVIIFIETRRVVKAMFNYIRKLQNEVESCSKLKAAYVMGRTSGGSGDVLLEDLTEEEDLEELIEIRKHQEQALIDFREGKRNILIATSVVEEGLDIPACNVVIRYDFPQTYRAYVQSRGRARKRPAKFVFYIEEGDREEKQLTLQNFDDIEQLLKQYAQVHFTPDSDSEDEDEEERIPALVVEGSGAKVTPLQAIQRLNFYCSQLPSDTYTDTMPTEKTECLIGEEFQTTLTLPKLCPIDSVKGDAMPSKKLAKVSAAMKALRALYQCKELTDTLLPQFRQRERNPLLFNPETGRSVTVDQQLKIPSVLWRQNLKSTSLFYVYSINMSLTPKVSGFKEYFSNSPYHKVKCFGILSKLPLPACPAFDIFPRYGAVTVRIKLEGTLNVPCKVISRYQWFQEALFTHILLIHNVQFVEDHLFKNYLVLPLCRRAKGFMKKKTEDIQDTYIDVDSRFIDEMYRKWDEENGTWRFADIPTDHDKCMDCVIYQFYRWPENEMPTNKEISDNNALFIVMGISDRTANSKMKDKENQPTFKDYHEGRYPNMPISCPDEPLLNCRHVSRKYNMLADLKETVSDVYAKNAMELIRETHQVHPMPASLWNQATCLPSILWRLETLYLAAELNTSTGLFDNHEVMIPRAHITDYFNDDIINLVGMLRRDIVYKGAIDWVETLQCITHKSCHELFNLERLEFLGDNFLKISSTMFYYRTMPDRHEGWLSKFRSQLVSNENLAVRCSQTIKLPRFILNKNVRPEKQWIPPCFLPKRVAAELKKEEKKELLLYMEYESETGYEQELLLELCGMIPDEHKQSLATKDVADSMEAFLGLCFSRYGYRKTVELLDLIKITKFQCPDSEVVDKFGDWLYKPSPPPQVLSLPPYTIQRARDLTNTLDGVQNVINYRFKEPLYLLEALTHASYGEINICYQRLEFLGDAVLDILIVCNIYQDNPHYDQGKLSDLKSSLVCNTTLSKICTKLQLHKSLKYESPELYNVLAKFYMNFTSSELEEWCDDYSLARVFSNSVKHDTLEEIPVIDLEYKVVQTPKILGDIVESVIGAIFLDCEENFKVVWDVIRPWFEHFYVKYCQKPPKNPRTLLYEAYPLAIQKTVAQLDQYRCKASVKISSRETAKTYSFATIGRDRETALDVSFERAWIFHSTNLCGTSAEVVT